MAVEILNGDPAAAIVEYIDHSPNSLEAMTPHGRSALGRWIIGSVTGRFPVRTRGGSPNYGHNKARRLKFRVFCFLGIPDQCHRFYLYRTS